MADGMSDERLLRLLRKARSANRELEEVAYLFVVSGDYPNGNRLSAIVRQLNEWINKQR